VTCQRSVEVVSVCAHALIVKSVAHSLCANCLEFGRCRSDWLSTKSVGQTFEIPLSEPTSVRAGDVVALDIDQQSLTGQMFKLYAPPLIGLMVPIIFGQMHDCSEVVQAITSTAGVGLGWLFSRYWTRTFQIRIYQ
jgi:positive regulator of sigma E activity